ncbi:MAG: Mur ligase family protein [Thermoguttaceae bacterium]
MYVQGENHTTVNLKHLFKSKAPLIVNGIEGGSADLDVRSCSKIARDVQPEDAYFAVVPPTTLVNQKDSLTDWDSTEDDSALEFHTQWSDEDLACSIQTAINRGCKVIVADRPIGNLPVPLLVVPSPAHAYGVCAHALWGNPGKSLQMIGISGTYGKTSTSYLIAGMLSEAGSPVGLIGSLGIYDGEKMFPSTQTTPAPEEIAYWLNRMVANGCTSAIIEISSQAIVESHLAGLKFDAVCMTNIRRNHLDYHHSVESYRRAKLDVFQLTKKKGIVICNADDRVTGAVLPLIDRPVLTVGVKNACEVSGMSLERNMGDQTFLITAGQETVPLHTKMVGEGHLYNCLSAAALGIGLGIDLRTAIRGIERVESIPGRMERIDCGQPFGVFVDCAPTPESLAGNLRSLRQITNGRLFCVLGADENRDQTRRSIMGRTLEVLADVAVITADELQAPGESPDWNTVEEILNGAKDTSNIHVMEDRLKGITWTLSNAEEGDCVLIIGSGCSDLQRFLEAEENTLCDRHFVRDWLYENKPAQHPTLMF